MVEKTKKGDFVEIKYTGLANNEIFDSNIDEDLKKLNPEAKPFETIVVIGEKMVVPGSTALWKTKSLTKNTKSLFLRSTDLAHVEEN
jgi:FKBP-type peptidyl-prolyl cis-trans isomerase 2